MMKNQKKDKPLRANFAAFENVSYHLNATPLSVAVLVPCAWSKILACGGAWQGIVNSAKHNTATNSVWQVFADKTMHGDTANSAWQAWQNGWCLWAKRAKQKWGSIWAEDFSLSLSLSLSLPALFWHTKIFKRFIFGILRFILCEKISKPKFKQIQPFIALNLAKIQHVG